MSYSASDFLDDVVSWLAHKGYTLHECDDGFHFAWARPDGRGDVEVGDVCVEETYAWKTALEHWLNNTDILFEETPDAYLVTVGDHQYAVLDIDDTQLVDDRTNAGAIVEPLFLPAKKGT